MADLPCDIPATLAAGETWQWRRALAAYPASEGWELTYYLRGAGALTAVAGADGDAHLVTVAAEGEGSSEALPAGTYLVRARVAKDGQVFPVTARTTVEVTPNVATAAAGALQSHAEKTLAALEGEIARRLSGAGGAADSYTILGRQVSKVPLTELYALRARYAQEVARLRRPGGLPPAIEVTIGRA